MVNTLGGHLRLDMNYTGIMMVGGCVENLGPATFLASTVCCQWSPLFLQSANNTTIIYLTIATQVRTMIRTHRSRASLGFF